MAAWWPRSACHGRSSRNSTTLCSTVVGGGLGGVVGHVTEFCKRHMHDQRLAAAEVRGSGPTAVPRGLARPHGRSRRLPRSVAAMRPAHAVSMSAAVSAAPAQVFSGHGFSLRLLPGFAATRHEPRLRHRLPPSHCSLAERCRWRRGGARVPAPPCFQASGSVFSRIEHQVVGDVVGAVAGIAAPPPSWATRPETPSKSPLPLPSLMSPAA